MAQFNLISTNFTAGELSPLLEGRTDISRYYNSAKQLMNVIALPHGGVSRTPGTLFIEATKDSAKKSRLIPFQFSTEQGYILEFGDKYIRFYFRNGGQILSTDVPYEITTDYEEDELFQLQYAQDADYMYIVHPNHKPQELTRTGHTAWSLDDYAPASDPFTSEDDYPSAVTIFQQRLFFGGTNNEPQAIWGSKTGDYDVMTTGASDDDALKFVIGSEEVNLIRWLSSNSKVLVGATTGGLFAITGGNDAPLTPTNLRADRDTSFGAAKVMPKKIGNFVYYAQRNNIVLREFGYSLEVDSHKAKDVSILSEHLLHAKIKEIAYQQHPYNLLWCVLDDGGVAVMTRELEHEVVGWTRQVVTGEYESVACIAGDDGEDEVWVIVKREIDGQTVRYVERLANFEFNYIEDAVNVHSCISLNNPKAVTSIIDGVVTATAHGFENGDTVIITKSGNENIDFHKFVISEVETNTFEIDTEIDTGACEVRKCFNSVLGLDHLEGQTVSIVTDGAVHPSRTVTGGEVSLDYFAGLVHAGLHYSSLVQLNRIEASPGTQASAQGLIKKVYSCMIRLHRSVGCKVGTEKQKDTVLFRRPGDRMDIAVPLFSGDKAMQFPGGYDKDGYVFIEQDAPLPFTVLAVVRKCEITEGTTGEN